MIVAVEIPQSVLDKIDSLVRYSCPVPEELDEKWLSEEARRVRAEYKKNGGRFQSRSKAVLHFLNAAFVKQFLIEETRVLESERDALRAEAEKLHTKPHAPPRLPEAKSVEAPKSKKSKSAGA